MHWWIQITAAEAMELENKNEVPMGSGYRYLDESTGKQMVEYHIDACNKFQERVNCNVGGNLSVQRSPDQQPLIAFGHDECIFKQFTFSLKSWIGPNGKSVVMPKDDGMGIMISAFQSQEFGFGLKNLSEEQLKTVNQSQEGKTYKDEEAAVSK